MALDQISPGIQEIVDHVLSAEDIGKCNVSRTISSLFYWWRTRCKINCVNVLMQAVSFSGVMVMTWRGWCFMLF